MCPEVIRVMQKGENRTVTERKDKLMELARKSGLLNRGRCELTTSSGSWMRAWVYQKQEKWFYGWTASWRPTGFGGANEWSETPRDTKEEIVLDLVAALEQPITSYYEKHGDPLDDPELGTIGLRVAYAGDDDYWYKDYHSLLGKWPDSGKYAKKKNWTHVEELPSGKLVGKH